MTPPHVLWKVILKAVSIFTLASSDLDLHFLFFSQRKYLLALLSVSKILSPGVAMLKEKLISPTFFPSKRGNFSLR